MIHTPSACGLSVDSNVTGPRVLNGKFKKSNTWKILLVTWLVVI
jgi:hypothetical protein